jgi:PAS domain S-box-containing protein
MSSAGDSSGEPVRAMLDDLPVMVWTSGADGATGHWNASAREWFGISREQSRGPLTEFIHADDREAALARWEQAVSADRPLSSRFRARAASSEYRWLALSGTPRRDGAGRIIGWACALTDIHDCKLAEEKFRDIFETAPVGIFRSTVDGRPISVNSTLATLFGFQSPEEFIRSVADLGGLYVNPEKRGELIRRAMDSGEFVHDEVEYQRRDGSRFPSYYYVRTTRHGNGETDVEGFIVDITERKRAEEALREAHNALERRVEERTAELSAANERLTELDRLKSQFLASMSHELRTPLNSIIGFTSLLRRGLSGPVNEEQVKQLGIVQSSASHLLGLIDDLLDVSRVEAGRADLLREPFNFVEVVNEVTRSLQPMADHKGLRVVVDVAQPAIPMLGDRKRALQILLNLVTNALKFTEKGTVRVAAVSSENTLRVEVADTGIGIQAEHLGMLFEAFRQIDGSAQRVYEGTGLGLYLCRKLLTLMGGEIRVESEYGKGSRFLYSMPLELAAGPG